MDSIHFSQNKFSREKVAIGIGITIGIVFTFRSQIDSDSDPDSDSDFQAVFAQPFDVYTRIMQERLLEAAKKDVVQIEIKLLTQLKQYLPEPDLAGNVRSIEIAEPARVKNVLEKLNIPPDMPKVIMLNNRQGAMDDEVAPGDRVTMFPPVGGG